MTSTWTKKVPAGAGSRRKLPSSSVKVKSVSSAPTTEIFAPPSGTLTLVEVTVAGRPGYGGSVGPPPPASREEKTRP